MDNNLKNKAQETWEASKDTAKAVINQEDISKEWQRTREAAQDLYSSGVDMAADTFDKAKHKVTDWQETACECIQQHPWKSVGLAFLSGFLVAALLKRS
ncbi:MAG: YqjD family protein [Burkholderiales bacterium]